MFSRKFKHNLVQKLGKFSHLNSVKETNGNQPNKKIKYFFCWNHRQIEKAFVAFQLSHLASKKYMTEHGPQVKQGKECTSAWRPACNLTPVASYITCQQYPMSETPPTIS